MREKKQTIHDLIYIDVNHLFILYLLLISSDQKKNS